ncbi:MAG TPA: hypothetical protein VGX03_24395 [Candidatus Binatia bacterium]|nr:hypothetical protein [Candidatus Binatia bacterium]
MAVSFSILLWSLVHLTGCSTVKSVIPGMGSDSPSGAAVGEKLHFKITPEEAIAILQEVAPQNGWKVASTGDQFDLQGLRGKYFRLETEKFLGGKKDMSGVFFSEPSGSYVVVGKSNMGLPQELTGPFLAAVEARTKTAGEP